jgi:hypothetical protein
MEPTLTLLIAGLESETIWMVSDSAISGGEVPLRDREYEIKIVPSNDGKALVGFSGDHYHGTRIVEQAVQAPAGRDTLRSLVSENIQCPSVDLAYGFIDEVGPHLFRISKAEARDLKSFHIGDADAFGHFQRIRHAREIDPTPKAVGTFMMGTRATTKCPGALTRATLSMLRLFAELAERDVGGWAIPYMLTAEGAFLCAYAYSISDPILDTVAPGSLVPHGTAEAGGFTLSVTELGKNEGLIIYWPQLPGGYLFVRRNTGLDQVKILGSPTEFKRTAAQVTGKPIEIFIGDAPLGRPESITITHDKDGKPSMAIARRGHTLSFSVLNVETVFHSTTSLDFASDRKIVEGVVLGKIKLGISEDRKEVTLSILEGCEVSGHVALTAKQLDELFARLGEMRLTMPEQISAEPVREPGSQEWVVVDPAWRTDMGMHPELDGIIMRLRHLAFGWLTFLLPHHEAASLGKWLTDNAKTPPRHS